MSLRPLAAGGFRIEDRNTWKAKTAVVDSWHLPSVPLDDLSLNRKGAVIGSARRHAAFKGRSDVLARYHAGFGWQGDDASTEYWVPQGLTGADDSSDAADGRQKWLAVSWHNEHDDVEKGMRLSLADVTTWKSPIRYRNILLVNPVAAGNGSRATFEPIPAHAGGALWFRNYLYVTDSRGFERQRPGGVLVFDMTLIKEVDDSRDDVIGWSKTGDASYAYGYRYILPQVGHYVQVADGDRPLRWSFIGLDRTGSTRSLMMGEYTGRAQPPARLVWWPLETDTGRLQTGRDGRLDASLARACSSERFLQGCHSQDALADDGMVWLSRTSADDALYERPIDGGKGTTRQPWADQPEGLTYSPGSGNLWCVTERPGARAVFAVKRGNV